MGMWKSFNEYEQKDIQKQQKDTLRDELNNIALRIVKAREAKQNLLYNPLVEGEPLLGNTEKSWKVGEVEHFNRGFNESSRFYNCFPYQRKHGLKYVPPPKAENLQQLIDEEK